MNRFPLQPIVRDNYGTSRFVTNRIVQHLLDDGPFDMNSIAIWCHQNNIPDDEQAQFAQLIGYSVSGYGGLSYADEQSVAQADELAAGDV